jgi:hypothetical protein
MRRPLVRRIKAFPRVPSFCPQQALSIYLVSSDSPLTSTVTAANVDEIMPSPPAVFWRFADSSGLAVYILTSSIVGIGAGSARSPPSGNRCSVEPVRGKNHDEEPLVIAPLRYGADDSESHSRWQLDRTASRRLCRNFWMTACVPRASNNGKCRAVSPETTGGARRGRSPTSTERQRNPAGTKRRSTEGRKPPGFHAAPQEVPSTKNSIDRAGYRALQTAHMTAKIAPGASNYASAFPPQSHVSRNARVHLALKDVPGVRTSIGIGEERQVVIHPATDPPKARLAFVLSMELVAPIWGVLGFWVPQVRS